MIHPIVISYCKSSLVVVFSGFVFLSLCLADEGLSFDYRFYVEFIEEVRVVSFSDFVGGLIMYFPYYPFGVFGRFEFGFAGLVYILSIFLSGGVLYGAIGFLSIYIKLDVIRRMGGSIFLIFMFFIMFAMLFETNAIRAGVALALFMFGLYQFEFLARRVLGFLIALSSVAFHLSSAVLVLVLISYILIARAKRPRLALYIFLFSLVFAFVGMATVLDVMAWLLGGKIREYLILSREFGLYTGASGLKLSAISALLLALFFLHIITGGAARQPDFEGKAMLGLLFAFVSAGVVLFSGPMSVIGDRLWQMTFPVAFSIYGWIRSKDRMSYLSIFSGGKVASNSVYLVLVLIVPLAMGTMIVGNVLIRYPQSNVFSFLTGEKDLIPPQVK